MTQRAYCEHIQIRTHSQNGYRNKMLDFSSTTRKMFVIRMFKVPTPKLTGSNRDERVIGAPLMNTLITIRDHCEYMCEPRLKI